MKYIIALSVAMAFAQYVVVPAIDVTTATAAISAHKQALEEVSK